jgi:manganese/iron transport system permease protein
MRIPFIGICVAHAALAGAVFAALFGLEGQWLMLPALFTSGLTSLLLGVTNPRWIKMDDNVMMSVLFSATMGLAFLGLGLFSVMGRTDGDVRTLLWGSIAFCRWSDVWIMLCVGLLLALFILVFYKELQAILFSREIATASGIRTGAIWGGFLLLTALVFTVSLQSVGGLMVYSLVTNPAAAAFQLTRGTARCILLSAFFGTVSGLGGFLISALTDLPSGAVIVLLSSSIVLVSALWRLGKKR